MITENVSTLKINKLTNEQYNRELDAGNVDEKALYLTPDDGYSKAEIEAMMPKVVVSSCVYGGNNTYINIDSSELRLLRKINKEIIVYLVLGTCTLDNIAQPSAIINLCSNISSPHANTLKCVMNNQEGYDWGVFDVNSSNRSYFSNNPLLILAVKGDSFGSNFEYVHWLNPPRASG